MNIGYSTRMYPQRRKTVVAPKYSNILTLFHPGVADSAHHCRGCTKNFLVDTSLCFIVLMIPIFLTSGERSMFEILESPIQNTFLRRCRLVFFNVVCAVSRTDWYYYPEEGARHDSCMSIFPRHFEAVLPTAFDIYTPTMPRALLLLPNRSAMVFSHGQLFFLFGLFKRQLLKP